MPTFDLDALSVTAPQGYEAKMVVLTGPEESYGLKERPFRRNVVIARDEVAPGADAETYSKQQLGLLAQNMQGFTRVKTETLEIDGATVPLVDARSVGPGGVLLGNLIAYVVKGNVAFTLSASHLLGPRFEQHRDEFLNVFKSVVVRL